MGFIWGWGRGVGWGGGRDSESEANQFLSDNTLTEVYLWLIGLCVHLPYMR